MPTAPRKTLHKQHTQGANTMTIVLPITERPILPECRCLGFGWYSDPRGPIPCRCKLAEWAERERAKMGPRRHATLDAFDPDRVISDPVAWDDREWSVGDQYAALDHAVRAARSFVANPHGAWIMFTGPNGSGKSTLACAITNALLDQGWRARYLPRTTTLFSDLKAGLDEGSFESRLETYCTVDLLTIEDMGSERVTDWGLEQLWEILDERYTHERTTILTSNLRADRMPARIADRLFERGDEVLLPVESFRRIGKVYA